MKIDLSGISLFESDELELDKKVTFIFGKNGVGKSTITEEFRKQDANYDVSIFQGFKNVIDDNQRLNAVVLGEENTIISRQIEEKRKKIEEKRAEIKAIELTLIKPEVDGTSNFFTRREDALKEYNLAIKRIEEFYTQAAASMKKEENPRIVSTSYNKRNFQDDINSAILLQEDEVKQLLATIKSEVRIAPEIVFPKVDLEKLHEDINNIIKDKVVEKVKISRIENSPERRDFAKQGLRIHKKGEVCAFCGHTVSDEVFKELESYFSADEVKLFQEKINVKIENLEVLIESIDAIKILETDFYPMYVDEIKKLKDDVEVIKKEYVFYLKKMKKALEEKQRYLFEERDVVKVNLPVDFSEVEKRYLDIQASNNSNDLQQKKEEAIEKMKCHRIKQLLDEFDYSSKNAEAGILLTQNEQRKTEFFIEQNKITGAGGLNEEIETIQKDIMILQNQTKNEKLLAQRINDKLCHMVSFELVHVEEQKSKGFYRVKDCISGNIRDITQLSTGEKNIIAFLYFIEKLDEVKEEPSNKSRLIVFDDPMNSNDDGMQYIIIEELRNLMKKMSQTDFFVLLTHNKHFYLNVKYDCKYNENRFIRFQSDGEKTRFLLIEKKENDFKTSYDSLWQELKLLYEYNATSADMLLNPIRRIIETYTNFNAINKTVFCSKVVGAKKLFDVNSHSIDDIEAELNAKSKKDIVQMLYDCFDRNGNPEHFKSHWKSVTVDEKGLILLNN